MLMLTHTQARTAGTGLFIIFYI